ncbi:MAG: hypothetical protein JNL60_13650 [Bacteroidia bacterium]|nr:hypothetical protein [Bacteroidia bacterium]
MLKVYDYLGELMEWRMRRERFSGPRFTHFAGDIREMLEIQEHREFEDAIQRTIQTLQSLNIPFERNFKRVFRFNGEQMVADWKVSPLAMYLIIINCDPVHETVARAQLFFLMTQK